MDLLLAHPYFLAEDPAERQVMKPYPPLGLLYLSSHLKRHGIDVGIFDGTFRSFAEFLAALDRERPPVVGIYANLMTKRHVLRLTTACRSRGVAVVVGGPDPPHYAAEYLEHGADVVVVGEGELTLAELLPRLARGKGRRDLTDVRGVAFRDDEGRVVRTEPRPLIPDLDGQPLPDREAIDLDAYLATWRRYHGAGSVSLITARGCPYTCTWCSRSVFGETHRRRSPGKVADEVEHIIARWAPDQLWYADDVFTIHRGWILKYADEMRRRSLRLPFECISRAERIDDDVADALQELGCARLWIGSESGSQRMLDAMDRRVTVEQVQAATHRLRRRGIEVGMFIMLGYDGEDETDLRATVDHLRRAGPDVFLTTVAYPIKGTEYYARIEGAIAGRGAWTDSTDRDLTVRGRHSARYYRFARRWMVAEVGRHRHWQQGRYLRAAGAATSATVGRLGMALSRNEREG